MKFMAQFQENKRPSGFVILSGAKDLSSDRDPSLRSELALERSEGMTLLKRLRLTRKTSSLQCIGPCARGVAFDPFRYFLPALCPR